MDDYEIEDGPCPHCGNAVLHAQQCHVLGCEDGWIDEHDDDPINYAPGEELRVCEECHGSGFQRWCPACGKDVALGERPEPMLAELAERLVAAMQQASDTKLQDLIVECDQAGLGRLIHEVQLAPVIAALAARILLEREAARPPAETWGSGRGERAILRERVTCQ